MTIPSNYEINVATPPTVQAKYGRHYCKIELSDCSPATAIKKFNTIKGFFPDDWVLDLYEVTCFSSAVDIEEA